MAELEDRYDDNVNGEFYVDDQCIDCDDVNVAGGCYREERITQRRFL